MNAELVDAFTSGNDDNSVGAFVVTGAGRGFCTDADISEMFTKQLLTANGAEPDLDLVQPRELTALKEAYATAEHREAVAAVIERRSPKFR